MTKVYAICNQKGGVGKSTTAECLGEALRRRGRNVLFIDLDPQGNLSYAMRAAPSEGAFELMEDPARASELIQAARAPLVPASNRLTIADQAFASTGKEYRLKEALEGVKAAFDYILIDTPPALGILTVNALTAADRVIIPALADVYSLQGTGQLKGTIDTVRRYCNRALTIDGILLTKYNARTVIGRELADAMEETAAEFGTELYAARVRESIAIREAQVQRASIFDYAPECNAAKDYMSLAAELEGRRGT